MKTYLFTSAALFGVYAFFHLLRVLMSWPAQAGEWQIPVWFSGLGLMLNAGLCLWALRLLFKSQNAA
jgi:hypothetical protein